MYKEQLHTERNPKILKRVGNNNILHDCHGRFRRSSHSNNKYLEF